MRVLVTPSKGEPQTLAGWVAVYIDTLRSRDFSGMGYTPYPFKVSARRIRDGFVKATWTPTAA